MSRVIVLNDLINFEPEKKNFNSRDAHVHISAPASYCFQLLIEKQGELVTHEELFHYGWRQFGMEVTANTLYQNISLIRRGLETCGLQEDIIRTMPRRGFILSPAVKIQYTRTRDLLAEPVVVESYADTPEPQKPHSDADTVEISETYSAQPANPVDSSVVTESVTVDDDRKGRIVKHKYLFERHASPKLVASTKVAKFMLSCWYYLAILGAIFTLGYLTLFIFFNPNIRGIDYQFLTNYNGCSYFINGDGETDQRSIDFIRSLNHKCAFSKYNYLTRYTYGGAVSLISCKKPLSYFSGSVCPSEFIIGVEDE